MLRRLSFSSSTLLRPHVQSCVIATTLQAQLGLVSAVILPLDILGEVSLLVHWAYVSGFLLLHIDLCQGKDCEGYVIKYCVH